MWIFASCCFDALPPKPPHFPFSPFSLCQGTMLQAIERYMKQAIVDKVPSVSSSALVSSLVSKEKICVNLCQFCEFCVRLGRGICCGFALSVSCLFISLENHEKTVPFLSSNSFLQYIHPNNFFSAKFSSSLQSV